jgi:glucuronate isomerase
MPMSKPLILHDDRLLPLDPGARAIARRLYARVRALPIVSPHGHTDPAWFAGNAPFENPAALLITPDHYLLRMLYSQGIPLERLGVAPRDGSGYERDPRKVWRLFAEHYHLFRGTPTRTWLDWVFAEVFGLKDRLDAAAADQYYDAIAARLAQPDYRPRALFERFNIEVLATTESPLDALDHHRALRSSGWRGRVITAFRPDPVLDPEFEGFRDNLAELGQIAGCDTRSYTGYLEALRKRRAYFASFGATSTDHGHPTPARSMRVSALRTSTRRTPSCSAPTC